MKKFWKWTNRIAKNEETQEQIQERTLFLNGTIADESWFDDDVTPQIYLVPEEYDSRLIDALTEENIIRKLGHTITTSGEHKINIAATKPAAAWIDEGGALTFGDATYIAGLT